MGLCGTEFGTHKDALSAVFFVQEKLLYQNERAKAENCVFSCEEWYLTSPVVVREAFSESRQLAQRRTARPYSERESTLAFSTGSLPSELREPRGWEMIGVREMQDTRRARYPLSRADLHLMSTELAAESGGPLFWGEFYSKDGVPA